MSQVTVIFKDGTDIYFARQLVNERLQEVKSQLPPGLEPAMGPIASGLGEIFMYTIDADPKARKADGTAYTATDLRTLQDWVIRPQLRGLPGAQAVGQFRGQERVERGQGVGEGPPGLLHDARHRLVIARSQILLNRPRQFRRLYGGHREGGGKRDAGYDARREHAETAWSANGREGRAIERAV